MPQVGDMIIETYHDKKHVGLVRDIKLDSYGHQRNVYIEWSGNPPAGYNEKHGYCGNNIHNIRERYDVVRDGASIK